jgi:hypothetical protein
MDIEEFNKNFPSFEKQYNTYKHKQAKLEKETLKNQQIIKLSNNFPNVSWENLQKQNKDLSTDDGCTHYIDTSTNEIYSWNFIDEEWIQHNINYQKSLFDLFN